MSSNYPNLRFTPENSAIVLVDHQTGLLVGVQDVDQDMIRRHAATLARTSKIFNLPIVLTTSAEQGPNGPLIPAITNEVPDVTVVQRTGEIDAFDSAQFTAAVDETAGCYPCGLAMGISMVDMSLL
ncbi:MAG: hypothetical protein SWN10_21845 [Pseudomonadota bacterium]|nr:hypothetical protein [Pseudomonadota bacterium]